MRFERNDDQIHVYRADDSLLFATQIVDGRIYIPGMYHYAFEVDNVDLQQDPLTGRRKYVELATIRQYVASCVTKNNGEDEESDINEPQVTKAPRSVQKQPKTSRYSDLQAEKRNRLDIRLLADNLKNALISNHCDSSLRQSVLNDAIVLLDDKTINWSSIDKLDQFREENLDYYNDVEIDNVFYDNATDVKYPVNKFSTEGYWCGKEIITVAERFYNVSEEIKNDYVRAMFTSAARSTLNHFAFPKTNKGRLRKVRLDDLIHIARVLLDMRYDYGFCVLRMPDFLLRQDRNYDVDNILQRAKELYERHGLELAFRHDDNPSNYKDIHINAAVTDRIAELI